MRIDALKRFGVIETLPVEKLEMHDVRLGRALFWDKRLSVDGKTACASCHPAEDWGADRHHFSTDATGKLTSRNSQTVFNAVLQPQLRWTGDRKPGANQAERSLTGSLGFKTADEVVPLLTRFDYKDRFRNAFPDEKEPVSPKNYATAIEAYERTLVTPAPFDRFLNGDNDALTADQKHGLKRFMAVGCADCHKGKLFGGESFEKFGVAKDYWTATKSEKKDQGRFEVTKDESDRYKFRVSMLRNIEKTGPYFHDGSVETLTEAIQVMADVQLGSRLSDSDATAVVTFLNSLTGEVPKNYSRP